MSNADSSRGRIGLTIILPFLLALILISLAVPRFFAAIALAPGDPIFERIRARDGVVTDEDLRKLAQSRARAARWIDSANIWTEQGIAYRALARRAGLDGEEGRQLAERSLASTVKGLRLAPVDPYAWLRLADTVIRLDGPSPEAARYLMISAVTGPQERTIAVPRLRLALASWELLDEDARDIFRRQIGLHWAASGCALARDVIRSGTESVVAQILASDLDALTQFNDCLRGAGLWRRT